MVCLRNENDIKNIKKYKNITIWEIVLFLNQKKKNQKKRVKIQLNHNQKRLIYLSRSKR